MVRKHPQHVYEFYSSVNPVLCVPASNECCKHSYSCDIDEDDNLNLVSDSDSEDELIADLQSFDCMIDTEHSYSTATFSHLSMNNDFQTALTDYIGIII